jgi:hypothetical protein
MSVRAYKVVVPAKLAGDSSFNIWHDEAVINHLEDAGASIYERLTEGGGVIELERGQVERALNEAKLAEKNNTSPEEAEKFTADVETLEYILSDFSPKDYIKGEDYVIYECY